MTEPVVVTPVVEEKVPELPKDTIPSLKEFLATLPNSPPPEQIEKWKEKYGCVYTTPFADDEIYIWRPLRREELKKIQQQATADQLDNFAQEELVIQNCILWPKNMEALLAKGGTISTLHEQIMFASNFVPPQLALNLVQKL